MYHKTGGSGGGSASGSWGSTRNQMRFGVYPAAAAPALVEVSTGCKHFLDDLLGWLVSSVVI